MTGNGHPGLSGTAAAGDGRAPNPEKGSQLLENHGCQWLLPLGNPARGPKAPRPVSRRDLSRHESWRPAGTDLRGRPGSRAFLGNAGGGLPQDRLADPRLSPDAQSFSCGGRDAPAQSRRRDEVVSGTNGRRGGPTSCGRSETGNGRAEGGTDRGRGVATLLLERSGPAPTNEDRREQGSDRDAAATRNRADPGLDRPTIAPGVSAHAGELSEARKESPIAGPLCDPFAELAPDPTTDRRCGEVADVRGGVVNRDASPGLQIRSSAARGRSTRKASCP